MTFRLLLLFFLLLPAPLPAQDADTAAAETQQLQQTRQQLQGIGRSLVEKRAQIEQLRAELAAAEDDTTRQELEQAIAEQEAARRSLRESFESIALGGVDLSVFSEERQQEFDWRAELQQVLRPLFEELKDLTEKPRTIERLRSELALTEQRLEVASRVVENLERVPTEGLSETTVARLEDLQQNWRQRLDDLQRQREVAQLQLGNLLGQSESVLDQIGNSLHTFFSGRGLNLILAIAAFFIVWFLLQGLLRLFQKRAERLHYERRQKTRLFVFGFRIVSVLLAIAAALLVLYVAGDLVLLGLALILLLALALSFRTYLPRYLAETRLVLNLGAARERERVVYQGVPWRIRSIGMYSRLSNPELENGTLRLPLSEMLQLISRPCREEEPWFPCRPDEYVLLGDGTFALVERQTPEIVQLRVMNQTVLYPTADFLAARPRNLSRGSFLAIVTFGIDYRHQPISTGEVADIFHQAVERAFADSPLAEHTEGVLVEFKEAGASSLDYLVIVTLNGAAAGYYYKAGRMIQSACVDVCNARGWVIPFSQLTIHQGEGFEALRGPGEDDGSG